jgi:hypothetical protein
MSRGKSRRYKDNKLAKVKKKPKKDALDPLSGVKIPPNLRPIIDGMRQTYERRVRFAEMKALKQNQELVKSIEDIRANQVTLQTLLYEANLIDQKKFVQEYKKYFNEVIGVVEKGGKMNGMILVDTFNINVSPIPNSLDQLQNKNKKPIIIDRG